MTLSGSAPFKLETTAWTIPDVRAPHREHVAAWSETVFLQRGQKINTSQGTPETGKGGGNVVYPNICSQR
jgi:hypothetical protein